MKTEKDIQDHYDGFVEFFGDNWSAAFDEMVYFRKMLLRAHSIVLRHRGDPKADDWLAKYDVIVEIENKQQ